MGEQKELLRKNRIRLSIDSLIVWTDSLIGSADSLMAFLVGSD